MWQVAGFRWVPSGAEERNQVSTEAPTHLEQPSSRQRPRQINLPVTLHLDCINVELGPITAIGRTWQSLSTVILASQERLLLNRADKAFFRPTTKLKKSLDFFFSPHSVSFNPVISIANQIKECVRVFFSPPSLLPFLIQRNESKPLKGRFQLKGLNIQRL